MKLADALPEHAETPALPPTPPPPRTLRDFVDEIPVRALVVNPLLVAGASGLGYGTSVLGMYGLSRIPAVRQAFNKLPPEVKFGIAASAVAAATAAVPLATSIHQMATKAVLSNEIDRLRREKAERQQSAPPKTASAVVEVYRMAMERV
jgi:hypothetical protein